MCIRDSSGLAGLSRPHTQARRPASRNDTCARPRSPPEGRLAASACPGGPKRPPSPGARGGSVHRAPIGTGRA
eukprot:12338427-Alexandrium_andersonii.AAC.1